MTLNWFMVNRTAAIPTTSVVPAIAWSALVQLLRASESSYENLDTV